VWVGNLLDDLDKRHLVAETNALGLLVARSGAPTLEPLPRVRENEGPFQLVCKLRSPWNNRLFGFELLNAMLSVSVDGRQVSARDVFGTNWNHQQYVGELPPQPTGKHHVRCEVESALVSAADLAGLAPDAPPGDWPPTRRRWTRVCEGDFVVCAADAEIVGLTVDPAFDPVAGGLLSVGHVIIRLKGGQPTAFVPFNAHPKPGLPVSVDVTLRLAGQSFECGTLWAEKRADGSSASGGSEFTAVIGPLDPQIREAQILLTPNPKAIDSHPGVDLIWGREAVFSHVPLSRQDLPAAKP
jgi:hypothetical protein